jgi:hypothetical protein
MRGIEMKKERGAETHLGKVLKRKALHTFRVESAESKAESEAEWLGVSSTSYVSFF